jgi:hypothetical protein
MFITSRRGINQVMNQPAYLEKFVLALASQPTWSAPVILWHALLSLSLRQSSSSSHRECTMLSSRRRHKTLDNITERSHIHPASLKSLLRIGNLDEVSPTGLEFSP